MNQSIQANPLTSREDLQKALLDMIRPYEDLMSPGCAWIQPGPPGATFSDRAIYLEGFARILWGLVPFLAGGGEYHHWDKFLTGITNGTDPRHPEFWGDPGDYDQLLVEMAVFGYALCLIPDKIWDPLETKAKANFSKWLAAINHRKIPECNWVFFRILVNSGLMKVNACVFDKKALEDSLEMVEQFYIGEGWYNDGFPDKRRARDYYIPWAMHYYGLIFDMSMGDEYPDQAARYRERAELFAQDYVHWFTAQGDALPYGRSLTYRFAQGSFWGAYALIPEPAMPMESIKGLLFRHLRWWFKQPIFTGNHLLSVGYSYPNLLMAERYNSPNSPLWAMKAFIPLVLKKNHPFWEVKEASLEKKPISLQKKPGFIFTDSKESGHLYALSAGQWTPGESNEHNHFAEKYSKFAYSAYFGFNIATDLYGLDKMGHDNMLLVSEGDSYYRFRTESTDHEIQYGFIKSSWQPFPWMQIETWLIPLGPWHLRLHRISSERDFSSAEGGFALPYSDCDRPLDTALKNSDSTEYTTEAGFSGIKDLGKNRKGEIIISNPNGNIIHPRTLIPTLTASHTKGQTWLLCAVLAHQAPEQGKSIWNKKLPPLPQGIPGEIMEKLNLE